MDEQKKRVRSDKEISPLSSLPISPHPFPSPLIPSHPFSSALLQARKAFAVGEVPVGAVVVHNGKIIASAHNLTESRNDPTAHAEMLAIRAACEVLASPRLPDCDLYVTLEPCAMCAQAIAFARIRRLYYGASDPKTGGVEQGARVFSHATCHHKPDVYSGMAESECKQLLQDFFQQRRG